jgi:hypothetical protein
MPWPSVLRCPTGALTSQVDEGTTARSSLRADPHTVRATKLVVIAELASWSDAETLHCRPSMGGAQLPVASQSVTRLAGVSKRVHRADRGALRGSPYSVFPFEHLDD